MDGRSQVRLTVALVVRTATWLRDEEAAGSNPATPTEKFQLDAMITKLGDHGIDHLLAIRWRDRTPRASDVGSEMAAPASMGLGIL